MNSGRKMHKMTKCSKGIMKKENRKKGRIYEEKSVEYLLQKGYRIQEKNYTRKTGEIDIICYDKNTLVFIEVKYREHNFYGKPEEAVDYYKRKHILKTAMWYVKEKKLFSITPRFDIISWEKDSPTHYIAAFDASDMSYI